MSTLPHMETRLHDAPQDIISAVRFSPSQSQGLKLLASSWDATVRLYNLNDNKMTHKFDAPSAQYDCSFIDPQHGVSAGADKTLYIYDLEATRRMPIGQHDEPIRCVDYNRDKNLLTTGSWDHTVKIWDPRSPGDVRSMAQPERVYTMHSCKDQLIVGTAQRHILIWDVRQTSGPMQERESNLKFQTRCVRFFPQGDAYTIGSIEGRVAVEYVDLNVEVQKKKYAFKCHRAKDKETLEETAYPVHAISFHPIYSTFATGGHDGMIYIWDGARRKRLCSLKKQPAPIYSLSFNRDGNYLAYAVSHLYDDDNVAEKPTQDFIVARKIDDEAKPK